MSSMPTSSDPWQDSAGAIADAWNPIPEEDRSASLETKVRRCPVGGVRLDPSQQRQPPNHADSYPVGPTVLYGAFHGGTPADHQDELVVSAKHDEVNTDDAERARPGLPRIGDELGGFRLILELGRGAFARVFLAEEINLGQRLVALKISRAEGDEPRMLARLQHTHIVPVHSVHDDPATGLRLLCMPFFGGANLAQLLQEASGLSQSYATGRSLVEALDQFSQRLPSLAGRESMASLPSHRGSRCRSKAAPGEATNSPVLLPSPTPDGSTAASTSLWRFRSLVHRLVPRREFVQEVNDRDEGLPSRRFLRAADGIRASVWIVARLAEGLDHAHSRGLLHRDLKPANILIAADGTPMLLDFNLAAEVEPESGADEDEIQRAMIGGTLPYMSPEHLDAFDPEGTTVPEAVDERSDLYALGLILFELIAGSPPFPAPAEGSTPLRMIRAMIAERRRAPIPSLRAICPEVSYSLDALVNQCLQPDPAKRFATAGDLADDLRRFLDDLPMKHCPEPSLRERLGKWIRRHPGLRGTTTIAILALVLLAMLGGATYLTYDAMLGVAARVKLQQFDREFADAQFLLNVAVPDEDWTRRGQARARDALQRAGLASPINDHSERSAVASAGWIERLAPEERRRVRRQVIELVLLVARSDVRLASREGSEEDRRQALERAVARLGVAERIDGAAPAALFRDRARYHAALGEADLAARDRARAEQSNPGDAWDQTLLGTSLLAAGEIVDAEAVLRSAIARDPRSIWAWFALGHCYFEQGRYQDAAGAFNACVALGPDHAWGHFNRALALARAGRPGEAKSSYDRALEIAPDLAEARVNRGLVALELNEPERAVEDFREAIAGGRRDLGVLAAYGETLARLGRRDEAEGLFDELLRGKPLDPVALVARGMSRLRVDPERAREDFATVLEYHPEDAMAHYGMARVIRKDDHTAALRHLDSALASRPDLIDALELRALERAHLGDHSTVDDVDRLLKVPTARRYYNAACALAIYSGKARDTQSLDRAMELLENALKSGFSPREAASDPDLEPLRERPDYARLLGRR